MRKEIEYSEKIPGDRGNYGWAISMDETGGYLGIDQDGDNKESERRVLLSPKQVAAVFVFYRKLHPRKRLADEIEKAKARTGKDRGT